MQGIYYLLSIVAVFVVIVWYIRNDSLPEGEPTRGLLAMKQSGEDPCAGKGKKRRDKSKAQIGVRPSKLG